MSAAGLSYEEFRKEALRYQAEAAGHPERYRAGVVAFLILGYACIVAMVVLLPALLWLALLGLAGHQLALLAAFATPVLIAVWILSLKTIWVRFPEPEGRRLTSSEAPALFGLTEELCRRLEAPVPERVHVSPEFQAGVVQRPMLGVFGYYRNYLVVGWPLMQALTEQQFRSVLAHEIGHLSRSHGRLASWIYRQQRIWSSLRTRLEGGEDGSMVGRAMIGPFIRWYVPRLTARAQVLARQHEYEADLCAVEMTSRAVAAGALVRIVAARRWLAEEYHAMLGREAEVSAEVPSEYFTRMGAAFERPLPESQAAAWIRQAWSRPTDLHETHPALADRLRALGVEDPGEVPGAEVRAGQSAGAVILGARNEELGRELDQGFRQHVASSWRAQAEEARAARTQLAALTRAAGERALTEKESLERIRLTNNLEGAAAAAEFAAAFLAQYSDPPMVRCILGTAMVQRGEEAGVTHLRIAMERDRRLRLMVSAILFEYFWPRGRTEEAELVRGINLNASAEAHEADAERARFNKNSVFSGPGLPPAYAAGLRKALEQYPELVEAYLVRRVVKRQPARASYILVVRFRMTLEDLRPFAGRREALRIRLLREIRWPEETNAFSLNRQDQMTRQRLRWCQGAKLVDRRWPALRWLGLP